MKYLLPSLTLIALFTVSCSSNSSNNNLSSLNGFIQKGPFIQGSEVFIQEVDHNLYPTGRLFITETLDDAGSFYLEGAAVNTQYLDIKTAGFYFNEVTGSLSNANITLNAIVDSAENSSINVNILTSLSYERIKYLMLNDGMTLQDARNQAEYEVLRIFSIDKNSFDPQLTSFSQMNITQAGSGNAILLAVSSILQWDNSEAELSELIAKISADIKTDGTLDNLIYRDEIRNNAMNVVPSTIASNMVNRYNSLGMAISVPNFEEFIDADGDGVINYIETRDPQFGLAAGVYDHDISLTLSSQTGSAIIYYSTDGSDPTSASNVYSGPIQISGDGTVMTVKAFAVKEGLADSNVVTGTYSIKYPAAAEPMFSILAGTYNGDITLSLSSATPGAVIYYTTDGSDPTSASNVYAGPIQISGDGTVMTVKAFAVKAGTENSSIVKSYYKIDYNYDPSQYMTNLTISDYDINILGNWVGQVKTPWSSPYNVEITFYGTGHYSARSISPAVQHWYPAFYYGLDEDSDYKTYDIYDTYADGRALGTIVIYFGGISTNTGSLRFVTFYNSFKNMRFEFWHRDAYGPVEFLLTRKE